MNKILIIEAPFYEEITSKSLEECKKILHGLNMQYDVFSVPGALQIPSAMNIILEATDYIGVIAIGCVIKGETNHYKHIAKECIRSFNEMSLFYSIPSGYGVIVTDNYKMAAERAVRYAAQATHACLSLIKIQEHVSSFSDEEDDNESFSN